MTRADDDRPAVLALRTTAEKLLQTAYLPERRTGQATWLPAEDPHRDSVVSGGG